MLGWFVNISRKWLEIEARFQCTTNRKWHVVNWMVSWSVMSRDRKVKVVAPMYLGPIILKQLKIKLGYSGAVIGRNGTWGIKWSRVRWRHMTLKGRGHASSNLGCKYIKKHLKIWFQIQRTFWMLSSLPQVRPRPQCSWMQCVCTDGLQNDVFLQFK